MRLKRHADFFKILENSSKKKKTVHFKYMNNADRLIFQDFLDAISVTSFEDLRPYMKKFEGDYNDRIASYLYDPTEHKEALEKYHLKDDYPMAVNFMSYVDDLGSQWNDSKITSNEFIEGVISDLKSILDNYEMIDHNGRIYILSDEENRALPSTEVVDKYNL